MFMYEASAVTKQAPGSTAMTSGEKKLLEKRSTLVGWDINDEEKPARKRAILVICVVPKVSVCDVMSRSTGSTGTRARR